MSLPKRFPQDAGIQIACIYGQGGVSDQQQDSLKVGNMQVWSPGEHSWIGVNPEHLALSPQIRKTQSEFPRPPDPGSFVYCLKTTGRSDAVIIGQASDAVNPTTSTAGNMNLYMMNPYLQEAYNRVLEMYPLPDYQEKKKRGALIREVKEKSKQYSHSLLQGLPSQASLYQMAMITQQSVKNIETAKEHFANILGSNILSQLGGSVMSLGKMMGNLSNKDKKKIKEDMPPEVQAALESMAFLLPNIETSGGGFYATDAKVNEDVFMTNAVDLLSQCRSVSDICAVLSRVQTDTTLYGLEELDDIVIEYTTPFGGVTQYISANGDLWVANSNTTNATSNSKSSFSSFMSSSSIAGGSPSSIPGENMFGDSAGTMFDMIQRVFPNGEQTAIDTIEKTNRQNKATNRNGLVNSKNMSNLLGSLTQWLS